MKKTARLIITILTALISSIIAQNTTAAPALRGSYIRTQPDGSTFVVYLRGDEFTKLALTKDGRPVIKDVDGWYCYADIDASGNRHSSGIRVASSFTSTYSNADLDIKPNAAIIKAVNNAAHRKSAVKHTRGSRNISATRAGKEERAIVILAQFQDLKFKFTKQDFSDLLNKEGYDVNGATGSALDYFKYQFGDNISLTLDVGPVVTLSKGYAYYGENDSDGSDKRAYEAVIEACQLSDAEVDFSQYDLDGDGEVDNIFVFYAGTDEARGADDEHIWSHSWYIKDGAQKNIELDGKLLNRYAISSELAYYSSLKTESITPIGTFCHEFGHTLGLPDMYDTDYENSDGTSVGLWQTTSLMDYGSYNNDGRTPPNLNAFELETLGLGECHKLEAGNQNMPYIGDKKVYFRSESDYTGEYWLFEARKAEGWDAYIGGSGMLIYQIDKSDRPSGWSDSEGRELTAAERFLYNEINCRPDHQCIRIIPAKQTDNSVSDIFWPSNSKNEFSSHTTPGFVFWSGTGSELSLSNIKNSSDGMTFFVRSPLSSITADVFQDAAILQWYSDIESENGCTLTWADERGKSYSDNVMPYEDGMYSYTLEGLTDRTNYTVQVQVNSDTEKVSSYAFTTIALYKTSYPFIYLNSADRDSEGYFIQGTKIPLRIFNPIDVEKVSWYFDGRSISAAGDGYYSITKDGVLRAVIDYSNGSQEIISKIIKVR